MESRKKMMVKPQAGPLVLTVDSLTSRELLVQFLVFFFVNFWSYLGHHTSSPTSLTVAEFSLKMSEPHI